MSVEPRRGCGYRKVGGMYLCGSGVTVSCDRLPYELHYCPTCGSGLQFSRNFQWLNFHKFAGNHLLGDEDVLCVDKIRPCYICQPSEHPQLYGILWVGEQYYSPTSFVKEALELGVSKRIPFIPRELKLGETIVLFAHKKGIEAPKDNDKPEWLPSIFYAFKPQRVEMLLYEKDITDEKVEELNKRGITIIPIPNNDLDHSDSDNIKMAMDPVTKKFTRILIEE